MYLSALIMEAKKGKQTVEIERHDDGCYQVSRYTLNLYVEPIWKKSVLSSCHYQYKGFQSVTGLWSGSKADPFDASVTFSNSADKLQWCQFKLTTYLSVA